MCQAVSEMEARPTRGCRQGSSHGCLVELLRRDPASPRGADLGVNRGADVDPGHGLGLGGGNADRP